MRALFLVAMLSVAHVPAVAMQAQPTEPAAPAPAQPAARFSLDTPIEVLVADPAAFAVLNANLPGIVDHPAYPQFRAFSLRQVQAFSQGALTDEILAKIATELAALG